MRIASAARILTLTFVLSSTMAARANLVTNGSFETGPSIPVFPPFVSLTAGSTAITGWLVTAGNIDYGINGNGSWAASDGARSLDMNGNAAGTIAQTFATIAGGLYDVLFDLAGDFYGGPAIKVLRVSAAGQSQDYSFNATGHTASNMGWTTKTFEFTATGTSTTLSFASRDIQEATSCSNYNLGAGVACFGPTLDNVRVTAVVASVPEPATIVLMGLGLAGLGWRKRRCLRT